MRAKKVYEKFNLSWDETWEDSDDLKVARNLLVGVYGGEEEGLVELIDEALAIIDGYQTRVVHHYVGNNDYVLSTDEYNALDKVLTKSRLYDSGLVLCQFAGSNPLPENPTKKDVKKWLETAYDYFRDYDIDIAVDFGYKYDPDEDGDPYREVTLRDGLYQVWEAASGYKENYTMTDEEIETFRQLLIKVGAILETIPLK